MGLVINKGTYNDLETPERIKAFQEARAFGSGEAYYDYRRRWDDEPNTREETEYPIHVDLELSTKCTLRCPFCYTITPQFHERVGRQFMDFGLFRKVIDEIAGKVPSLRLSLRGEPTLHPDFLKCIHYAKRKGILEVSTLTNLSMMTPEFFEKVMLAGLDWMSVSFDGLYEEYEKNRAPLKFSESYEKLRKIKEIKAAYHTPKPAITLQSIWPAIESNPSEFYNMMLPVTDIIMYHSLMDYQNPDRFAVDHDYVCPQPYQRLTIQVTGEVSFCSFDEYSSHPSLGNVRDTTIYDIWHGDALREIRQIHLEKGCQAIELCRECPLTKLSRDKFFKVNGRTVSITEYVPKEEAEIKP